MARGAILAGMAPTTLVCARFVVGTVLFALTLYFTEVGKARGTQRPLDDKGLLIALAAGVVNGLTLLTATSGLATPLVVPRLRYLRHSKPPSPC